MTRGGAAKKDLNYIRAFGRELCEAVLTSRRRCRPSGRRRRFRCFSSSGKPAVRASLEVRLPGFWRTAAKKFLSRLFIPPIP